MGRQRGGGHREPMLHADAQRVLAAGDYPPRVKHTILMALRGGRPGKQVCLACSKTARHCQFWVPPELLQVASASTAKPVVYWLCDAHYGALADAEIVTLLTQQKHSRKGAR